jgi:hypothetical protein
VIFWSWSSHLGRRPSLSRYIVYLRVSADLTRGNVKH